MAVDPGERYIGIAISDPDKKIASPMRVFDKKKEPNYMDSISQIIKEEGVSTVLIGRPLSLKGTSLPMTTKAEQLAEAIKKENDVLIKLVDERLSSKIASSYGNNGRVEGRIDAQAAAIFLQNHLDMLARKNV